MHVSNSHSERSAMAPAPVSEPTPSGAPELPVGATRARDGYRGRSAQSARYVVEPTSSAPPTDSVDEADVRLILEMRYQECAARRALDELFESGEAEILSL
jgi:hypothetical protein